MRNCVDFRIFRKFPKRMLNKYKIEENQFWSEQLEKSWIRQNDWNWTKQKWWNQFYYTYVVIYYTICSKMCSKIPNFGFRRFVSRFDQRHLFTTQIDFSKKFAKNWFWSWQKCQKSKFVEGLELSLGTHRDTDWL